MKNTPKEEYGWVCEWCGYVYKDITGKKLNRTLGQNIEYFNCDRTLNDLKKSFKCPGCVTYQPIPKNSNSTL